MATSPTRNITWFHPASRVPKRNQAVLVRTRSGQIRKATFLVAYTSDWPSGASWDVAQGVAPLRFGDVSAWTTGTPEDLLHLNEDESRAPAIVREVVEEIEHTRDVLALLPTGRLFWTPHPDIPSLQASAWRLTRVVQRIAWIASRDHVERSTLPRILPLQTPEEITGTYATFVGEVMEALPSLTAATLRQPWKLTDQGIEIVAMPRGDVLRAFGVRPLVYHRAEMALLLTALEVTPPHPYPEWELHPEMERRTPPAA